MPDTIRIDAGGRWTVEDVLPEPDYPGKEYLALRRVRRGKVERAGVIVEIGERPDGA